MGLLGSIGAGLASAADATVGIGMAQMKAAIEEERQTRLVELQEQVKIRAEDRQVERDKPEKDLRIKNLELQQEGLINKRVTDDIQSGTIKEGKLADGSFVTVGDDGVARRLSKDGTPMSSALGKDGTLAGVDAKTYGMDAKEKLGLKATEAQIRASNASAGTSALERELKVLAIDEAKKQKDPAGIALITQAAQHLENGDKKSAMKALKTASDSYGNKSAAELMVKIATTPAESSVVETTRDPQGNVMETKETIKSKGQANKPVTGGKPWTGSWKVN